ncbi:MAG: hypothetical protein JWR48_4331, partial [Mycobacterium sp.]|nr:hypothetical protein [Mycobacterium sp.]
AVSTDKTSESLVLASFHSLKALIII